MKPVTITVFTLVMTAAGASRAEMRAFGGDIVKLAEQNTDFRRVVFTGPNLQLVVMAVPPGQDIGEEAHEVDQCFFFVRGTAQAIVEGRTASIGEGGALCVPAGAHHDVRNTGGEPLKLYTTYAPPQHPPGAVHHTKEEAQRAEKAKAVRAEAE